MRRTALLHHHSQDAMENAYTRTPGEALKHFQVTEERGLSEPQVKGLRDKHGKNGTHPSDFELEAVD